MITFVELACRTGFTYPSGAELVEERTAVLGISRLGIVGACYWVSGLVEGFAHGVGEREDGLEMVRIWDVAS